MPTAKHRSRTRERSELAVVWVVGMLVCLSGTLLLAQEGPAPSSETSQSESDARPLQSTQPSPAMALPAEAVGPDDLLEIMVPYCVELSRTFRISSDGTLILPLIHHPIAAAGLLPSELAERLKAELQKEEVMNDPVVSISVIEYRSRPISVVGAVNHPLTFQATGETTLLDAIARAGGLAPGAGAAILVTSRQVGREPEVTTISTTKLLSSADPALNLRMHGGEEVRIPEAGKIFVAGNVRRPGMYVMQSDSQTTVVKALALSEGLQPFSASFAYIYRQQKQGGDRLEIKVALSRIMARKEPDVALMPDDIFYIPENGGKKMTSRVLTQIAGFGQTTAAGMLIYR